MSLFKSAATVSALTFLSRITGLIRETLTASIFGAGPLTDAFIVAFRLPNLLRRLFAEGAFTQAFVPILGEYKNRLGDGEAKRLVDVTLECLELGIQQVKPGNTVGHIGQAIQRYAQKHGYSVVRDFCGHGVGVEFHEPPDVLHFGRNGRGAVLRENMTFTIEPMLNAGGPKCTILDDGWTCITVDGSLSAQWEHTVRVTADGVEVLTAPATH